jgi:hypothetical protein
LGRTAQRQNNGLAAFSPNRWSKPMSIRKKIAAATFVLMAGIGSAFATSDACIACDNAFWQCGGYQNDYCTMHFERCLRRNGCPGLY